MKKLLYCCIVLLALSCKEKFTPPSTAPNKGYLVVDGVINSGQGPTSIKLSRTVVLADSARLKPETKALVRVEGEDNSRYVLTEGAAGTYGIPQLTLNNNTKYRLYIKTTEGKEYLSDFAKPMKTPPIDNIRWEQPYDLQLFINTHDPTNNTRYYRWEFEDTWEFRSTYTSQLKYTTNIRGEINGVDYRYRDQRIEESIIVCWQGSTFNSLLIGSSAKLVRDSIDLPIHKILHGSWQLSQLYSIKVRQNALSSKGYDFFQRMKKNTESTGTLFDAQPSELKGNIHCQSDPSELVIGFMEVADIQEKRIFIYAHELNNWGYLSGCTETEVLNNIDSIRANASLMPTMVMKTTPAGNILTFGVSIPTCVDCTLRGTNVKPAFWP